MKKETLFKCAVLSILVLCVIFESVQCNRIKSIFTAKTERRTEITDNSTDTVRVIPIIVDFPILLFQREQYQLDESAILFKIFGSGNAQQFSQDSSMNAFYNEISYGRLVLKNDVLDNAIERGCFRIALDKPSTYYAWGHDMPTAPDSTTDGEDDVNNALIKEFVLDVLGEVLNQNPTYDFQDKNIIIILNEFTSRFNGRAAIGFIPGASAYPSIFPASNQELFIGHYIVDTPQKPQPITLVRTAWVIDEDFPFLPSDSTERNYITERSQEFNNGNDQFIKGLALFCRDAEMSCAVHDVLHGVKRISAQIPTTNFPGKRTRAMPCLYNLSLQTIWMNANFDRSIYCAPYIGWWDDMGDHLHTLPSERSGFLSGQPYGLCAFSKLKLGVIYPEEIDSLEIGTHVTDAVFSLNPLAERQLLNGTARTVKIKLDTFEYLLIEYRKRIQGSVDDVPVDISTLLGDETSDPGYQGYGASNYLNPPDTLISDEGILIYHVNETKSQFGNLVSPADADSNFAQNDEFVTNFVVFLYTPSMINSSPNGEASYPEWDANTVRGPEDLKNAAFREDSEFKLRWNERELITIHVGSVTDETATIRVTKEAIRKT